MGEDKEWLQKDTKTPHPPEGFKMSLRGLREDVEDIL
jgi:hypothetical protein